MPLADIRLDLDQAPLPDTVRRFLEEAEQRIERFQRDSSIPGFVSCNLEQAYRALRAVAHVHIGPRRLFCEWGCGFGVVASLAAMLGFHAVGIEIEPRLVDEAKRLADDFNVSVEIVLGSILPPGSDVHVEIGTGFSWLKTEQTLDSVYDPDDFDLIFAYPWPAEEDVTAILFERYAAPQALLLSYLGENTFRLRRKVAGASRKPGRRARRG